MHKYSSFYELLKAESPEKVFPGTKTVEEGKKKKKALPSPFITFCVSLCLLTVFHILRYANVQEMV